MTNTDKYNDSAKKPLTPLEQRMAFLQGVQMAAEEREAQQKKPLNRLEQHQAFMQGIAQGPRLG